MANEIGSAAIGAGASIGGQSIGMIGQRKRENRAVNNQMKLMDVQMQNQMTLNRQGQDIQMENWKNTNYPAQVAMLKEAGLNPALLYGIGGGGGTTTGSQGGGSASGGSSPSPQYMPLDIGNALKTAAEIALLKAEENKTKVEAAKIGGVDTEETKSRIDKLKAETENTEIRSKLESIQADIAEIEKANKQSYITAEINNILENTKKTGLENQISSEAMNSIILEIEERAIGQHLNNILTKSKTNLTETEIKKLKSDTVQKWTELGIMETGTKIKKFEAEMHAEYPGAWNVIGSVLKKAYDGLESIETLIRGKKQNTDTVK